MEITRVLRMSSASGAERSDPLENSAGTISCERSEEMQADDERKRVNRVDPVRAAWKRRSAAGLHKMRNNKADFCLDRDHILAPNPQTPSPKSGFSGLGRATGMRGPVPDCAPMAASRSPGG